jgi:hypothetical protein
MREKCDSGGELSGYIEDEEKKKLLVSLDEAEIWLGDQDVEELQKSAIITHFKELRKIGDLVVNREAEEKSRVQFVPLLLKNMEIVLKETQNPNKQHIEEEKRNKVAEEVTVFGNEFKKKLAEQEKRKKHEDPVFVCSAVRKEYETKWKEWNAILSKPKPAPPPPPPQQQQQPAAGAANADGAAPAPADKEGSNTTDGNKNVNKTEGGGGGGEGQAKGAAAAAAAVGVEEGTATTPIPGMETTSPTPEVKTSVKGEGQGHGGAHAGDGVMLDDFIMDEALSNNQSQEQQQQQQQQGGGGKVEEGEMAKE